jgi:hypothetical protein
VDESHHAPSSTYVTALKEFGAFDAVDPVPVVGCTATPKRLDRKMIHGQSDAVFEKLVYQYPIRDAIRDGYLCDIVGYVVKGIADLDNIKTSGGDFNQKDLSKAVNVESRTKKAIEHWKEIASDRKTIVFCVDVQHAMDVADAFRKAGVSALHVSGAMDSQERKRTISKFENGEAQVLTNVELATEGYDHKPINCVLMLRPTKSWGLFSQAIGRGTRIFPGKKNLLVIDVCDNTSKHNLATIPTILDLPPQLNLQGHSLLETAVMVDQLGENAQHLTEILAKTTGKAKKPEELQFDDLRTVLHQIDLLGRIQAPTPIKDWSNFDWVSNDSGYRLSVGRGANGIRSATVSKNHDGKWVLHLWEGKGLVHQLSLFQDEVGGTLEKTIASADFEIERMWSDTVFLAKSGAGWKTRKPTDKQRELLKRFGIAESVIALMSAGEASKFIDDKFASRRAGSVR